MAFLNVGRELLRTRVEGEHSAVLVAGLNDRHAGYFQLVAQHRRMLDSHPAQLVEVERAAAGGPQPPHHAQLLIVAQLGRCPVVGTHVLANARRARRSCATSAGGRGALSSTFTRVTLDELREAVTAGTVDTVLLAMTDMQGRLQGKRLTATHFLNEVVEHGAESCNYLLAVDVDMNTVGGYEMSSWERGYGDMQLLPDLDTLRPVPWQEGTVVCLADVAWLDGSEVVASPRQILRRQLARLAERGWVANAGTELEFLVFLDTYEEAWHKTYKDLRPANLYNVDYSLLGTARVEPLIRRIRNSMAAAGMVVEDSKGECNFGQHEINFRYADALRTADEHAIYKNGAKEIAADEGVALSFIAKFDEREGSSCHIHFSLADDSDPPAPLFGRDEELFRSFLAGQLACLREMTLLLAPNINSYKRYSAETFAPTAVAWGHDNRTCSLRVVGHGPSRRFENRVGGADLNPYLALSAIIASGLHGVDAGLELEPALEGNAYSAQDCPRVPATLRDARELFASSEVAREAFGGEVLAHYLNAADVELQAFQSAITDWELVRGFERL
jgi:glutamine synthetase